MCGPHWSTVPVKLRRLVLTTYRSGQCDDKRPSLDWHQAADAAIAAVALQEGCPPGKLRMVQVRALLALAPELLGDEADRMRKQLEERDRRRREEAENAE